MDEEYLDLANLAGITLDQINYILISKNRKPLDVEIIEYSKFTYSFVLVKENLYDKDIILESFTLRTFAFELVAFRKALQFSFWGD